MLKNLQKIVGREAGYLFFRRFVSQREVRYQRHIIDSNLSKDFRQAHVNTAFDCEDSRFAELFNELFKPTAIVEQAIRPATTESNGAYISVSSRFMELLGDFTEP